MDITVVYEKEIEQIIAANGDKNKIAGILHSHFYGTFDSAYKAGYERAEKMAKIDK